MPMKILSVVYGCTGTRSVATISRSCPSMENWNMDTAEELTRRSRYRLPFLKTRVNVDAAFCPVTSPILLRMRQLSSGLQQNSGDTPGAHLGTNGGASAAVALMQDVQQSGSWSEQVNVPVHFSTKSWLLMLRLTLPVEKQRIQNRDAASQLLLERDGGVNVHPVIHEDRIPRLVIRSTGRPI